MSSFLDGKYNDMVQQPQWYASVNPVAPAYLSLHSFSLFSLPPTPGSYM